MLEKKHAQPKTPGFHFPSVIELISTNNPRQTVPLIHEPVLCESTELGSKSAPLSPGTMKTVMHSK